MTEQIERGRCCCGSIVLEMQGNPFWVCYDHDSDCRRATGAALNVWVGDHIAQVHLLSGNPASFSRTPGIERTFCSVCGSSIGYVDQALVDERYFALGFFDHPEGFSPYAHAYFRERLKWMAVDDELPRFESYSRVREPEWGTPVERAAREGQPKKSEPD